MKRSLMVATILSLPLPALSQTSQITTNPTIRQPWMMKGLNADPSAALAAWPEAMKQFPGMNALRLSCVPDTRDSDDLIAKVVQLYTGAGVFVWPEDHSGNTRNFDWYRRMVELFKDNDLVGLETPNEPTGNVAQDQIDVINVIREAGFKNWIGVQPIAGWNRANLGTVFNVLGTQGLFVTPHVYYDGTDPNGAANFVQGEIDGCKQFGVQCVIDEFGDALNGFTRDPLGKSTIMAAIASNEAKNAGALFWAMGNGYHADGADSACAEPSCATLTSTGHDLIQPWLWGNDPINGLGAAPPAAIPTKNLSDQLTALSKQTDQAQKQNKMLEQAIAKKAVMPQATKQQTPQPTQEPAATQVEPQAQIPPVAQLEPQGITPDQAGVSSEQAAQISAAQSMASSLKSTLQQVQQELVDIQARAADVSAAPTIAPPAQNTSPSLLTSPSHKDNDGDDDDR